MNITEIVTDDEPTTIKVEVPVNQQFLHDVFVTACEGGINYWAEVTDYHWSDGNGNDDLYTFYAIVRDAEDEDGPVYRIDASILALGLQRLADGEVRHCAEQHQAKIIAAVLANDAGEIDADYADIIVQVGLLNEVTYG